MATDFSKSMTKTNLLKAFAGESQARNRYTFAASCAKKNKEFVIEAVFKFTAEQERAHAKIFYDFLKEFSGENIQINGTYPIDNYDNVEKLLKSAQHNELEEYETVYKSFAETAEEEGFPQISAAFKNIAEIENTHAERFGNLASLLSANKLYVSDSSTKWMCLNCGYIFEGTQVPDQCPVCQHDKGYFIRVELAPYTAIQ